MGLPLALSPGDQVYKYTLKQRLGGGSFGEVWLAHDQTVKKDFAVKFLDPSRTSISSVLKEAVVGYRAGHPNLVPVHYADVVSHQGASLVAVVMDYYVHGSSVGQVCPGNFIPIQAAIAWVIDILRGLEYLHAQGTLHNDVKPYNILIGANGQAVLTDYGISESTNGGASTKPGASYRLHQAPEVIKDNAISVATDVYQVGVTAFRLINGIGVVRDKLNFLGQDEFRRRVVAGELLTPADFLPFVPGNVRRVITKSINSNPGDRFQSALEMRRALEKLDVKGSWIVDSAGAYQGRDARCVYWFKSEPAKQGRYEFIAFRRYGSSGHQTRCGKFCAVDLTEKESEKRKAKFMTAVVEGKA